MTIAINDDICKKYGLTIQEVLAILLIKCDTNIPELLNSLEDKKAIVVDGIFSKHLVTQGYAELVDNILLDSDKDRQPQDRIEDLAVKMMALFPALKKQGSSQYFRGNKRDISLRLKKFFKLYGNTYSDEVILNATKKYVESHNGNYTYMRVLKYFIWKDEKKVDSEGKGYIEEISDLANYIENNKAETYNRNWLNEVR